MKSMKPIMVGMIVLILVSLYFAYAGIGMHSRVADEEAKFHQLQDEYFSLSKAERDSAASNSALNAKLVEINQYPSELLRLKLVGVGKILTGIFGLLLAILAALIMMPVRMSMLMKKN